MLWLYATTAASAASVSPSWNRTVPGKATVLLKYTLPVASFSVTAAALQSKVSFAWSREWDQLSLVKGTGAEKPRKVCGFTGSSCQGSSIWSVPSSS